MGPGEIDALIRRWNLRTAWTLRYEFTMAQRLKLEQAVLQEFGCAPWDAFGDRVEF
jgi:hypothetical protein